MTEAEWLECADPQRMLEFLRGKASDRKLRLLAVACCRRIQRLLSDERSRSALVAAEWFADGLFASHDLLPYYHAASQAAALLASDTPGFAAARAAADAVRTYRPHHEVGFCRAAEACSGAAATAMPKDRPAQCLLLRDIFGNPFRPVAFSPEWRTSTAVGIARGMYESRDFSAMPILADALQDAGCDSEDILSHCRGPGPHVRGCWVVDLVLGKE